MNANKTTIGVTGSYLRVDSLFGHQVVYTASISGLTGRLSSIQKVSYLGGVIFTLRQTTSRRTSVGLLLNIDPSVKVPVVPVISYWRKFENELELNINLPQQVSIRKTLTHRVWATFGTSLAGSVAFFRYNQPNLPRDANYSSIDIKTGPGVEVRFAKKLMFGINAGLLTNLQSRQFELNENANDYFLKSSINSTPFVNFTFSVLPFL